MIKYELSMGHVPQLRERVGHISFSYRRLSSNRCVYCGGVEARSSCGRRPRSRSRQVGRNHGGGDKAATQAEAFIGRH